MNHTGLKARMAIVGSVLFAFYALVAIVAVEAFGVSLPIVFLGTIGFAGFQYVVGKKIALWSAGAEDMSEERYPEIHRSVERIAADTGRSAAGLIGDKELLETLNTGLRKLMDDPYWQELVNEFSPGE